MAHRKPGFGGSKLGLASFAAGSSPTGTGTASVQTVASGMDTLWNDLDSGVGAWDNIPIIIRQGFRSLFSMVQAQQAHISRQEAEKDSDSNAWATEAEELRTAIYRSDQVARKLTSQQTTLIADVEKLRGSIEAKVDMDLVKAALATKSDRADVIAATNSITDITSRSEVLNARVSEVVSELRRFQEETKSGIITATRAANEARAAVSACLSAASLQESCFASAAGVNAVQEEVSKLGVELKEAWSKLELKADIEAVNEVLETKANKVTVAQALHNKISVSKFPELLAPVNERMMQVERQVAVLEATGKVTSSSRSDKEISTLNMVIDDRVRQSEARYQSRLDEMQGWLSSRCGVSEVTRLEAEIADVKTECRILQREVTRRAPAEGGGEDRLLSHQLQQVKEQVLNYGNELAALQSRLTHALEETHEHKALTVARAAYRDDTSSGRQHYATTDAASKERARAHSSGRPSLRSREGSSGLDGGYVSDGVGASGGASEGILELRCTRRDLDLLSKEVKAIASLLDLDSVTLHSLQPLHSGGGQAPSDSRGLISKAATASDNSRSTELPESTFSVSPTTACASLLDRVAGLTSRMGHVETEMEARAKAHSQLRRELADAKDKLLQHGDKLGSLDRAVTLVSDRTSELEACVLLLGGTNASARAIVRGRDPLYQHTVEHRPSSTGSGSRVSRARSPHFTSGTGAYVGPSGVRTGGTSSGFDGRADTAQAGLAGRNRFENSAHVEEFPLSSGARWRETKRPLHASDED